MLSWNIGNPHKSQLYPVDVQTCQPRGPFATLVQLQIRLQTVYKACSCKLQPGPINATSLPPIAGSAPAQLYPLMTQIGRKRQVFLEMPAWWQVSTTALTSL